MRVLVVEDQRSVARFIAKGLREQAYAVDVAEDGALGLEMAEIARYDIILLDLMLPKVDGFEVCRRLRERGVQTPILMLTARDDKRARIEGLDTGADDYLSKPFDFDELLARMRALLRRGAREYHAPTFRVADLELDTNTHGVRRAGREILLTAKEYALIEYFLRNPGRVIGRAEIAENVWDETFDPFSNSIEVYIARLRKKIDDHASVKLIHTRRGVGYVLEPRGETGTE
jgi:two-component system, OmpR family, copper resistance phosphate regulon response regulator CusR